MPNTPTPCEPRTKFGRATTAAGSCISSTRNPMPEGLFAQSATEGTMGNSKLHVTIHIDGGARGNPGPAAAGVVIRDAADGQAIYEGGLFLGKATNNQAEYNGLLSGLKQAIELGAVAADVFSDSELMVKQI